jgi:hypothetical protein
MSISTEQAEKMIDEKMAREAEKPAQPEASEKPVDQSTPEPKEEPKAEPEADKPKEEPKEEPKVETPEKDEKKPSDEDNPKPKRKYTHEERVAHAFSIEKQKRKEQHAKDRARIKELEDELARVKGLRLSDFDNNVDNYTDYRLKEREMQDEVKFTKERMEREESEELARETERRVKLSFPTEEERDDYNDLIRTNGKQFLEALNEVDPNGVVLDYLNSVDKYPIVLQKLMTDMDALKHVFRDKDPVMLRLNLHQFTKELLEGTPKKADAPTQTEQSTPPKPEVKPMPVIGKQVTTSSAPAEPVHDRNYWNNYLRQHPRG